MLTRKTPTTLATAITITGQGEDIKFNATFRNRTQDEIDAKFKELTESETGKQDATWVNRQMALYLIESMETEYPVTDEGFNEMEQDRPGLMEALFYAYHKARKVELAKN
ncbi:MAG TPA: hypothetical protein VF680_17380 [Allosphingosinicella sp.]|jgi:hypothetical protein